jgi:hypothetical protein
MAKQCSECPFRDPKNNQGFFNALDRLRARGTIDIHSCHMRCPDRSDPRTENEVCVGHRNYLKKRNEQVG